MDVLKKRFSLLAMQIDVLNARLMAWMTVPKSLQSRLWAPRSVRPGSARPYKARHAPVCCSGYISLAFV